MKPSERERERVEKMEADSSKRHYISCTHIWLMRAGSWTLKVEGCEGYGTGRAGAWGISDRHFIFGGRKSILLLQGSQAVPARPFEDTMRANTLRWYVGQTNTPEF
jgi:hypothetical protein